MADIVVIGGGAVGAATAWHLARRGAAVVLLDRWPARYGRTGGDGADRIFRPAAASARHLQLAAESLALWRELEAETGASLLTITGGVDHGDPLATAALAGRLAAAGVRREWLEPQEAQRRWPGMRFDGPVLHQPDGAGRLQADQALAAFTAAARGHGARVRRPLEATAIDVRHDDRVRVHTAAGPLDARRVVVAAGSATADLLDGVVRVPALDAAEDAVADVPFRQVSPCVAGVRDWPAFTHHGPSGYGIVDPCGDVTVGLRGGDAEQLRAYVATWLPALDADRARPLRRPATTGPDGEFVLFRDGPVIVAAGCSGHGITHVPAIGRALADLATEPSGRPVAVAG